jgi:cytochrome P450
LKKEIARARERGPGEDILSLLALARYDDGSLMDEDAICNEIATMVVAGHETTALGLTWAVDLLHRHGAALERVLAEIDALGPDPSPNDLANAAYLDAVCKETLRLYPLVTEVLRILRAPFELGGYRLEPGIAVGANILLAHRNPARFRDPDCFRPERFQENTFTPFEYLPFGGGHRRCIGASFAIYEMKIVLGALLSRYRVELLNASPPRPVRRNVTIAPNDGVPVRLRPRTNGVPGSAAQ